MNGQLRLWVDWRAQRPGPAKVRRCRKPSQIPPVCWGPRPAQHALGCHPRRPRCRWRRAEHEGWETCNCAAYWFPHRKGGGLCGDPARFEEALRDPFSIYNRRAR